MSTSTSIPTPTDNGYIFGGSDGNGINVTGGGNVSTSLIYDHIVNQGKILLRNKNGATAFQLPDCPCVKFILYAAPTNQANVWIGGITDQIPADNVGLPLIPGAKFSPQCTNPNLFSLYPTADGDSVTLTIFATAQANNVNITPSDPPNIDRTVPVISSTIPNNGLSYQPINSPISVLMNVAIDPSSINSTNIIAIPTIPSLSPIPDASNAKNVLLQYTGYLAGTTSYTFDIANLTSLTGYPMTAVGTFSFSTSNTTTPPDFTPPTLLSTNPVSGATNVLDSVAPTLTFSKPINPSSVTNTSIELTNVDIPAFVTGITFSQSPDLTQITMNCPSLNPGTNYRIDVWNTPTTGDGIQDTVGVYLDTTYSISFLTKLPYNITYNVTGNTYYDLQMTSGFREVGEAISSTASILIGKIPIYYSFILKNVGSPTGNIQLIWRRRNSAGDWPNIRTIGTVAVSSIGTSDTVIRFPDYSQTTAFVCQYPAEDFISILYGGGDSSNYVQVKVSNTDPFDGINTDALVVDYTGTFSFSGAYDIAGIIGTSN